MLKVLEQITVNFICKNKPFQNDRKVKIYYKYENKKGLYKKLLPRKV